MDDLRRLRLLDELRRRGTQAAVGEALGFSPSTVSHHLAALEAEIGVPLLVPDGRRVRLTQQGEVLADHVEAILGAAERARAAVAASMAEVAGTVRIAAFQTAALRIVPRVLASLAADHPGIRVQLRHMETEEALPALEGRELDVVVGEQYPGFGLPRPNGLTHEIVRADPLRLVVPPGWRPPHPAAGPGLSALRDMAWAMEPGWAASRRWATARCRAAGFEPDVRYETSDLLLQAELVRGGHAAAFLPDLVDPPSLGVDVLAGEPEDARQIVLVMREAAAADPALRACRAALLDAARAAPS